MTKPTISIAMATYNGARYLPDQLGTIAEQTVPPDELVVSDDQSSDGTLAILAEFARTAPFEVHVHQNSDRLGYIRNFRRAAGLCRSDLVSFCDQDDWWRNDKLEVVRAAFDHSDTLLVYHNARVVDENREGEGPLHYRDREESQLAVAPLSPWHHAFGMAQTFRSTLRRFDHLWDRSLSQISDQVDILSHDHWYMFLALVFGRVRFLDEMLVDYRQHGGNAVGSDPGGLRSRSRLLSRLEHYGRQDERSAAAARSRADVLRAIAAEDAGLRGKAEAVAAHYERFADKLQRRFRTYAGPTAAARLASLVDAVRTGDYRDWPWGFDPNSIPRDFLSGVVLKRVAEPVR